MGTFEVLISTDDAGVFVPLTVWDSDLAPSYTASVDGRNPDHAASEAAKVYVGRLTDTFAVRFRQGGGITLFRQVQRPTIERVAI